jgi:RimJ/RimL family protein N-acetyltransferase
MGSAIETVRLRLRRLRRSDEPALIALDSDPEVMRYVGSPPGVRAPAETADRARERIAADHGAHGWWAIEGRDGRFHGLGLLLPMPDGDELELGYRLARHAWGQGIATEAAAALTAHAFGPLARPVLAAVTYEANLASQRVLAKLGFEPVGPADYRGARVARFRLTAEAWARRAGPAGG